MSSPDDQNLGENDDHKKTVIEDFEKKLEISDDTGVDLQDDEKGTEGSGSSSSALIASDDKGGDEDDEALIAKSDEADEEKEIPMSTVEEITEEEGSSTSNLSEEIGEKKINDAEDQQDEDALIAKSDEADEEKENPISMVQEITEEEEGSSTLNLSSEDIGGEKKINHSEDQQDDDVLISTSDEEKENPIPTVEEITEKEEGSSSSLNISEEKGKKKINESVGDRFISKSDEVDEEKRNPSKLRPIGTKIATAGCFVNGGDSVLLAHDDGSCSLYDAAANFEEKLKFESDSSSEPTRNMFRDCWIVKAHGPNQESKKYIVATSSGNRRHHSGFYSWDFESGRIQTCYEVNESETRSLFSSPISPISACWHSPSDHLVAVALATLRSLTIHDVRDYENLTQWDLPQPVCPLQHTSPLQWRDKVKIVIAHPTHVSFWDTSHGQITTCGFGDEQINALHVNNLNPDADTGGIRQRASPDTSEGVVCTSRSIYVLDSRNKDGKGTRIDTESLRPHSVYCDSSRSIYMGCDYLASAENSSYIQHYSTRQARLVCWYGVRPTKRLDEDVRSVAVRQVWGGPRYVMAMCRGGLHVFDPSEDMTGGTRLAREIVGCGDEAVVRYPSFDFSGSKRLLLVNGHGPAQWKSLD